MDIESDFVHLVDLTLAEKMDDAAALTRRTLRSIAKRRPDLADQVRRLNVQLGSQTATRAVGGPPLPVDADSRLELLRREVIADFTIEPTWPRDVSAELEATIAEKASERELLRAGLSPSRSLLFVGPPGVGKTLAARWLASRLERPLVTLDLAAVMSSYLGRTGNNIRAVLEYARRNPSILLLDEFDAIAKRRDDVAEIGELKRLVTVLLQQVDEWPAGQLLLAATNHPELLDTAVWRRFDRVVRFPLPSTDEILTTMRRLLQAHGETTHELDDILPMLAVLYEGQSFADVTRSILAAQRHAVVYGEPLSDVVTMRAEGHAREASRDKRVAFAEALKRRGYSQRKAAKAAGVGRDTLRRRARSAGVARRKGETNGP